MFLPFSQCSLAQPCYSPTACVNTVKGFRCEPCPPGYWGKPILGVGLEYAQNHKQVLTKTHNHTYIYNRVANHVVFRLVSSIKKQAIKSVSSFVTLNVIMPIVPFHIIGVYFKATANYTESRYKSQSLSKICRRSAKMQEGRNHQKEPKRKKVLSGKKSAFDIMLDSCVLNSTKLFRRTRHR